MNESALVRPYAVTGGRTRSHAAEELPLETLALVNDVGRKALPSLMFERSAVVVLCGTLQSVAEVSPHLKVPLGVARVLVGDLYAEGLLDIHLPETALGGPSAALLGKVLDGLQAL